MSDPMFWSILIGGMVIGAAMGITMAIVLL